MKKKQDIQYTIRDIPARADSRLREVAALENISLNQAALRTLERGLGLSGEPIIYRRLRPLVSKTADLDRAAWNKTLSSMDVVDLEKWK